MTKQITINVFSAASVTRAIKELRDYKKDLDVKTEMFVERLRQIGIQSEIKYFRDAYYAGEPDVLIEDLPTKKTGHSFKARIRATGETVLFIEFGTGIYNENSYQAEYGYYAGSYGSKALQPWGWFYTGSPGPNHPPTTEPAHNRSGSVHTTGNPANQPVYRSRRDILLAVSKIAEEVFG